MINLPKTDFPNFDKIRKYEMSLRKLREKKKYSLNRNIFFLWYLMVFTATHQILDCYLLQNDNYCIFS